jgi:hypothetical protein
VDSARIPVGPRDVPFDKPPFDDRPPLRDDYIRTPTPSRDYRPPHERPPPRERVQPRGRYFLCKTPTAETLVQSRLTVLPNQHR